ncbi:pimeloyl-ACP methyl ester carboxylesterase [Kineosphaera limosa]|uniref:AB hydrolase-1 domain-containing protein n=1 Tax=Kineosphaera limosa NBRC 100340 TaxID=1184609 RepID=K6WRG1_9MICO|nr:alpha/beta hydrolase [Kineosphaera limosa]NYE00789.1 pimeloyl-ACP methyl ester carboxylesterase [Kineosphaera limosa]GAB96401.1 hypothetical protein KILIM_037_00200 [Kineosphaera limosa NBRC 100340]
MTQQLMDGIDARSVQTPRLRVNVLHHHQPQPPAHSDEPPVVFIHGNCSSSLFWQPLMRSLGRESYAIDLRGFGESETKPVDATRGLGDFADDVLATLDALGIERAHLVGWSMGAGVVQQVLLTRPQAVASLTLQAPVSPFGFGGTGPGGRLLTDDGAGTGGGGANPQFVQALAEGDRGDGPTSPRATYRALYVAPGHTDEFEDLWVTSMLTTATGPDNYPGDGSASQNWPGFAPGDRGVLNTMAPTHLNLSGIVDVGNKPPILWIRGTADAIVSDASGLDLNQLGKLGVIPGWPGEQSAPPQPMIAQTRQVLDAYAAAGGQVREIAWEGVGHSPHLERPQEFRAALLEHIG